MGADGNAAALGDRGEDSLRSCRPAPARPRRARIRQSPQTSRGSIACRDRRSPAATARPHPRGGSSLRLPANRKRHNQAFSRHYAGRIPSGWIGTSRSEAPPGRLARSERHAGLHQIAAAGQRVGRETARREGAGDRIVVVEGVEHIVDGDRPEEVIVGAAQLEIDRGVRRDDFPGSCPGRCP